MAVEVVVFDFVEIDRVGCGSMVREVGHACFHLSTNVNDDISVPAKQPDKLFVKLN
jgi:hypothetical protein